MLTGKKLEEFVKENINSDFCKTIYKKFIFKFIGYSGNFIIATTNKDISIKIIGLSLAEKYKSYLKESNVIIYNEEELKKNAGEYSLYVFTTDQIDIVWLKNNNKKMYSSFMKYFLSEDL